MADVTFEIVIKGTLSDSVLALIDGFAVSEVDDGRTHLIGPVPDQARLQGVLTVFGNLNIELVSVNQVSEDTGRAVGGSSVEDDAAETSTG